MALWSRSGGTTTIQGSLNSWLSTIAPATLEGVRRIREVVLARCGRHVHEEILTNSSEVDETPALLDKLGQEKELELLGVGVQLEEDRLAYRPPIGVELTNGNALKRVFLLRQSVQPSFVQIELCQRTQDTGDSPGTYQ